MSPVLGRALFASGLWAIGLVLAGVSSCADPDECEEALAKLTDDCALGRGASLVEDIGQCAGEAQCRADCVNEAECDQITSDAYDSDYARCLDDCHPEVPWP